MLCQVVDTEHAGTGELLISYGYPDTVFIFSAVMLFWGAQVTADGGALPV